MHRTLLGVMAHREKHQHTRQCTIIFEYENFSTYYEVASTAQRAMGWTGAEGGINRTTNLGSSTGHLYVLDNLTFYHDTFVPSNRYSSFLNFSFAFCFSICTHLGQKKNSTLEYYLYCWILLLSHCLILRLHIFIRGPSICEHHRCILKGLYQTLRRKSLHNHYRQRRYIIWKRVIALKRF